MEGDTDINHLRITISAAIDRDRQLTDVGDAKYKKRMNSGRKFTKFDRISLWLSKSYIWLIALFLALYVGLPFLAPVFLKAGLNFTCQGYLFDL